MTTEDAGRTWKFVGLKDSRHISRIVIHPKDPNTVWVAVIGHLFGLNTERGVYKTIDGGRTGRKFYSVMNKVAPLISSGARKSTNTLRKCMDRDTNTSTAWREWR
ncbi:MAG: hypothetical protein IPO63_14935 [Bacteroidetes bacterium]|nr:hypothetical protein [Bacteroidota bacterium]